MIKMVMNLAMNKRKKEDLAEKILKRAENGESFDDLALEHSDDV